MNEPRRWLESDELTPEERRVLEAGRRVEPPASARGAVRAALGAALGGSVLASGSTASGAIAASSFIKGLVLGLVVGGGASAGIMAFEPAVEASRRPVPELTHARAVASEPGSVKEPTAPPAERAAAVPRPAPRSSSPAAPEVRREPPAPASAAPEPSTGALPDLTEPSAPPARSGAGFALAESRRVAEARALLRRGDARGALSLLERTRAEFPGGFLAQEREALAIEALLAAGERSAARARAAAFLTQYPESPHAAAARRALAE